MFGPPGPSHSQLTDFISTIVPPKALDVNFIYHVPRYQTYTPSTATTTDVILSITPTAGVYTALSALRPRSSPLQFLHRPWALDRRQLPRDALVLASHKAFDEQLTVGWNVALASRLRFAVTPETICVQGYKGDAERKIGLLAPTISGSSIQLADAVTSIKAEFDGEGEVFDNGSSKISVIAIMNAFHPEEVERVIQAIQAAGWTKSPGRILYLTGQVREPGLEAAKAVGMPVVCVGHRACEEWGIKYLAAAIQTTFPRVGVQVILEEEEPRPPRVAQKTAETSGQEAPSME